MNRPSADCVGGRRGSAGYRHPVLGQNFLGWRGGSAGSTTCRSCPSRRGPPARMRLIRASCSASRRSGACQRLGHLVERQEPVEPIRVEALLRGGALGRSRPTGRADRRHRTNAGRPRRLDASHCAMNSSSTGAGRVSTGPSDSSPSARHETAVVHQPRDGSLGRDPMVVDQPQELHALGVEPLVPVRHRCERPPARTATPAATRKSSSRDPPTNATGLESANDDLVRPPPVAHDGAARRRSRRGATCPGCAQSPSRSTLPTFSSCW